MIVDFLLMRAYCRGFERTRLTSLKLWGVFEETVDEHCALAGQGDTRKIRTDSESHIADFDEIMSIFPRCLLAAMLRRCHTELVTLARSTCLNLGATRSFPFGVFAIPVGRNLASLLWNFTDSDRLSSGSSVEPQFQTSLLITASRHFLVVKSLLCANNGVGI
jgi:hypothetical protein